MNLLQMRAYTTLIVSWLKCSDKRGAASSSTYHLKSSATRRKHMANWIWPCLKKGEISGRLYMRRRCRISMLPDICVRVVVNLIIMREFHPNVFVAKMRINQLYWSNNLNNRNIRFSVKLSVPPLPLVMRMWDYIAMEHMLYHHNTRTYSHTHTLRSHSTLHPINTHGAYEQIESIKCILQLKSN